MRVFRLVQDREHHDLVIEAVRRAKRSVWISTANLKELRVPGRGSGRYVPVLDVFDGLARDGVELRMLHASLPSRAFRADFDARPRLVAGGLALRQCPRVHMKAVVVDGALLYLDARKLDEVFKPAHGPILWLRPMTPAVRAGRSRS